MPEDVTSATSESFYEGALRRIPRFMLAAAVVCSLGAWLRFGGRPAVGFASGCALAYLNLEGTRIGIRGSKRGPLTEDSPTLGRALRYCSVLCPTRRA